MLFANFFNHYYYYVFVIDNCLFFFCTTLYIRLSATFVNSIPCNNPLFSALIGLSDWASVGGASLWEAFVISYFHILHFSNPKTQQEAAHDADYWRFVATSN
jgi:hypothetical protein